MADAPLPTAGGAGMSARELALFHKNVARVADVVGGKMFAPAVEGACRLIVNESRRRDRPLAWNDVTGNLRSAISFQVEGGTGPKPIPALNGSGAVYNATEYRSGEAGGVHGVVFAAPEYAVHVEMKSSRSVLIEPLATVREALWKAIGEEAAKAWAELAGGIRFVQFS